MPTSLAYPQTNGFRAGFQSVILKIDKQEFTGFKSVEASHKRERAMVYGANADPIGKTRGKNSYTFKVEVYIAEFKAFITDHFGNGYSDAIFTCELDITENGYDTQTAQAFGCTVDENTLTAAEGTDALTVSMEFNPVKVIFNKVDDNARPLGGSVAIA